MTKRIRAYRRSARKQQIIKTLQIWRENGYATEATSYKLAKALDMVVSANFIGILKEMVKDGDLQVVEREQPGRWVTKFYSLSQVGHYHELFSRRHISVKRRGVVVGQMEMFS